MVEEVRGYERLSVTNSYQTIHSFQTIYLAQKAKNPLHYLT